MLIATHFALYGFPLLDVLAASALFISMVPAEAAAEGESKGAVYFKQTVERATYATARLYRSPRRFQC